MAATQQKRLREDSSETLEFDDSNSKRQKPHNNILSLLDEDDEQDEESSQGFSAIFTTLEQEISSSAAIDLDFLPFAAAEEEAHHQQTTTSASDEEEGLKSVMRHLLEASDDELGIPNYTEDGKIVEINSAENFQFGNFVDNGLWELEDVAANYYAMLQSQLFM